MNFIWRLERCDIFMLKGYLNLQNKDLSKEERKAEINYFRNKLEKQQLLIKDHKLPVVVLLEGWGAAGKGSAIKNIIRNIDPRFFSVVVMKTTSTEEEKRKPFLYRYFKVIPEEGHFAFLDAGWMDGLMQEKFFTDMPSERYESRISSIKTFERQLTDNGYLVLKLFLNINEKEQRKRLRKLEENPDTAWHVSEYDRWQNEHYEECFQEFDKYLTATNTPNAPWYIVDSTNIKMAELQVLQLLTNGIDTALENTKLSFPLLQNLFPLMHMPKLAEIQLDKTITEEEYKKQLKEKQKKLSELHNELYRLRVPVIVVYEGWDAAGKGGNIRRVTDALDPRGYEVMPIASPEPHEKSRHYLWRFWNRLPKDGHIAIFDRSWYGRVMVERIEGFCSKNDWQRAYHEINEFEKELVDWGAKIIKFWVHIDQDTQLKRFTDRQNTPEKQWKITEEDWRNREKWSEYEKAVNEMLKRTSTSFAPWYIIESNDKKYARIQSLDIIIKEITDALEKRKEER